MEGFVGLRGAKDLHATAGVSPTALSHSSLARSINENSSWPRKRLQRSQHLSKHFQQLMVKQCNEGESDVLRKICVYTDL